MGRTTQLSQDSSSFNSLIFVYVGGIVRMRSVLVEAGTFQDFPP